MSLIGMFHYRKDPNKVGRAYRYATIAKSEGIDFFYFSSSKVDFEKEIIKGLTLKNGQWIEEEFPFPDVIINHVGPITKKQSDIYNQLKKIIPFTSFPVGTKLSVYNRIKKGREFIDYLIPFKKLYKPIDVLLFLNKYPKIIMKPISGNHGKEIVFVEKDNDSFIVKDNNQTSTYERLEFLNYISELQKNSKMLIQKYIPCKTNSGEPFDIRLHLQKDKEGKWKNTLIYPKMGLKNKIATNLGQGGQVSILKVFLQHQYGDEYFNVMKYLEVFAIQFAKHFDMLYKHQFDELGIDIGLDENKKLWIYEVNWRPGHMFIEFNCAHNAVLYANYLAKKRGEKIEITETT